MPSQEKGSHGKKKQPKQRQCLSSAQRNEIGRKTNSHCGLEHEPYTHERILPSNRQDWHAMQEEGTLCHCLSVRYIRAPHTKHKVKYVNEQNEVEYVALNHITTSGTS